MTLFSGPRHGGLDSREVEVEVAAVHRQLERDRRAARARCRRCRGTPRTRRSPSGIFAMCARIICSERARSSAMHARHRLVAVAVEQRGQPLLADAERADLRLDVADPLLGHADVGEDDRRGCPRPSRRARKSFTGGRRSPSCWISVARARSRPAPSRRCPASGRCSTGTPRAGRGRRTASPSSRPSGGCRRVGVVDDEDVARLEVGARRSITARVVNCMTPTKIGSPSSPCAMTSPVVLR